MPFTISSGKHFTLRSRRFCKNCEVEQWHFATGYKLKPTPEPRVPPAHIKELTWICELCDTIVVEAKEVVEPTDKARIFNRLLKLGDDYDVLEMQLSSHPNEIILRIRLPDYDMGEIRAIQHKSEETGYISVEELIKLQRAGYRRPRDVPENPQPADRRLIRQRARERVFVGEPRSI